MTSHPKDCTHELIDTIAACNKVCRHIHLPVQSGSDRILAAMNRHYTVAHYLELIDYARARIPGVTFSSDIIVGFPGETRADFEQTLELIKRVRFNALYTFIYSPRPGTKAAGMEDPTPAADKSLWLRELLDAESDIRSGMQADAVGTTLRVLAEGEGRSGDGWLTGRTQGNDIVEFTAPRAMIGSFVDVTIERAQNWALFGRLKEG